MVNELSKGSFLYKNSKGLFDFYLNYREMQDGICFTEQNEGEVFADFIERTVKKLIDAKHI